MAYKPISYVNIGDLKRQTKQQALDNVASRQAEQTSRQEALRATGVANDWYAYSSENSALNKDYDNRIENRRMEEEHLGYLKNKPQYTQLYNEYSAKYGAQPSSSALQQERVAKQGQIYGKYSKALDKLKQYGWKF